MYVAINWGGIIVKYDDIEVEVNGYVTEEAKEEFHKMLAQILLDQFGPKALEKVLETM